MTEFDELAKAAVERLSEDEALRGDLGDDGFGPLLDWGVAAVFAYAVRATSAGAMEQYTDRLRGVIRAAVAAAEAGALKDPRPLLNFATGRRYETLRRLKGLRLGADADANAGQIADLLQAALEPVPPARPVPPPARRPKR